MQMPGICGNPHPCLRLLICAMIALGAGSLVARAQGSIPVLRGVFQGEAGYSVSCPNGLGGQQPLARGPQ
jgi:hypothetical protein